MEQVPSLSQQSSDDSISKCVVDKKMVENNLALDGEEILGIEQDPKKEVKEELAS